MRKRKNQLSKALGENREVSMADCVKLLRPNPAKSRVSRDFFKQIIEGNVEIGRASCRERV